jgi:Effector Associated Constant Component 1
VTDSYFGHLGSLGDVETDLIQQIIRNRLAPGETLHDVLAGSAYLADRRAQLVPHSPPEDNLVYIFALFTWWPFKPDLPSAAEALLLEYRATIFRGASDGEFELLDQVPDEVLSRSLTDLITRLLGDPDEYLSDLGIRAAQNEVVMQFQQAFLDTDELNRVVAIFRQELAAELDVDLSRIATPSVLPDVAGAAVAALIVSFAPTIAITAGPTLAAVLAEWIRQRKTRRVRLSRGSDTLEVSTASTESRRVLEAWLVGSVEPGDVPPMAATLLNEEANDDDSEGHGKPLGGSQFE